MHAKPETVARHISLSAYWRGVYVFFCRIVSIGKEIRADIMACACIESMT